MNYSLSVSAVPDALKTKQFLPSLNYAGSSAVGSTLKTAKQMGVDPSDYAVRDSATGKLVSLKTGQPWTGKAQDGQYYRDGEAATDPSTIPAQSNIDPNNPQQRYQAVDIIKSPEVAKQTADLMKTLKQNSDTALADFGQQLKDFKAEIAASKAKSAEATNAQPTIDALNTANARYSGDLDQSTLDYQRALADAAARERGVVKQAQDTLPMYDQAINSVIARQLGAVMQNLSKYKMGSGTPTSAGSAESQILARGAADASIPLEQAKIAQRYNILSGMALPTENAIASRAINYAGNYLPGVAGARYGSSTATANAIQGLKERVAGMSQDNAIRYMQSLGIPIQLQQQVLSGQISQLASLAALEDASRYRGLQDKLGMQISQPVNYSFVGGGFPSMAPSYPTSRYHPSEAAPVRLASNAPQVVSPGVKYNPIANRVLDPRSADTAASSTGRFMDDPNMGGYWDMDTGKFYAYGEPAVQGPVVAQNTPNQQQMAN